MFTREYREKLSEYLNRWGLFAGTFVRYGSVLESADETMLLQQIRDHKGDLVCDHLWIPLTREAERQWFGFGDRVLFTGFVEEYNYQNKPNRNLGISKIRDIQKVHINRHNAATA